MGKFEEYIPKLVITLAFLGAMNSNISAQRIHSRHHSNRITRVYSRSGNNFSNKIYKISEGVSGLLAMSNKSDIADNYELLKEYIGYKKADFAKDFTALAVKYATMNDRQACKELNIMNVYNRHCIASIKTIIGMVAKNYPELKNYPEFISNYVPTANDSLYKECTQGGYCADFKEQIKNDMQYENTKVYIASVKSSQNTSSGYHSFIIIANRDNNGNIYTTTCNYNSNWSKTTDLANLKVPVQQKSGLLFDLSMSIEDEIINSHVRQVGGKMKVVLNESEIKYIEQKEQSGAPTNIRTPKIENSDNGSHIAQYLQRVKSKISTNHNNDFALKTSKTFDATSLYFTNRQNTI